jgi:hypothetical protein
VTGRRASRTASAATPSRLGAGARRQTCADDPRPDRQGDEERLGVRTDDLRPGAVDPNDVDAAVGEYPNPRAVVGRTLHMHSSHGASGPGAGLAVGHRLKPTPVVGDRNPDEPPICPAAPSRFSAVRDDDQTEPV